MTYSECVHSISFPSLLNHVTPTSPSLQSFVRFYYNHRVPPSNTTNPNAFHTFNTAEGVVLLLIHPFKIRMERSPKPAQHKERDRTENLAYRRNSG